jgi:hypothetical protein
VLKSVQAESPERAAYGSLVCTLVELLDILLTWIAPNVIATAALLLTLRWRQQDVRPDFEVVAHALRALHDNEWVLVGVNVIVTSRCARPVPLDSARLVLAGQSDYALNLPQVLTGLPGTVPAYEAVRFTVAPDAVISFVQSLSNQQGLFPPNMQIAVGTGDGQGQQHWYSNNFSPVAAVPGRSV